MRQVTANRSARVITITFNTAIDYVVEIDSVVLGRTQRATRTERVPAGSGICVSVGVARLGHDSVAMGFVGAQSAGLFLALESEGIRCDLTEVPGETRTNVTLIGIDANQETHIQTTGYGVDGGAIQDLRRRVGEVVSADDVVVLAGSLPQGMAPEDLGDFVRLARSAGATVILDTTGPALDAGIGAHPDVVKPNAAELSALTGENVEELPDEELVSLLRQVSERGPSVAASLGARGVVAIEHESGLVWKAWLPGQHARADTAGVGSGDSFVAGLATSLLDGEQLCDALRLGVACGAANLGTRHPGRFRKADVDELYQLVRVVQFA